MAVLQEKYETYGTFLKVGVDGDRVFVALLFYEHRQDMLEEGACRTHVL
jgi:predicted HAD superfamily Cof-like phosphohydrolase